MQQVHVSHEFASEGERDAYVGWVWNFLNNPDDAAVAFRLTYGDGAFGDMAQRVANGEQPPDALAEILKREWREGAIVQ